MCKHSKADVTVLEQRQRGLDARGNDPAATKRESSWAVNVVSSVNDNDLQLQLQHARDLADEYADTGAGKKLKAALAQLPQNPSGIQITELLLDKDAGFKDLMDLVGNLVGNQHPDLQAKGREQPFFKDRGRKIMERPRAGSFSNPHGGIATGRDRSGSTSDVFAANVQHAKGSLIGDQTSETYKKFQDSGAPFVGGASGTVQFIVMDLESKKPIGQLSNAELQQREKLLALNSARLVAGGHHSMSECLIAAKAYGYFKNIPDPLNDYDASMKALEKHVGNLGLDGGKPLSRESEIQNDDPRAVRVRDRMAAVQKQFDRISDQIPENPKRPIEAAMRGARTWLNSSDYDEAMRKLDDAESRIRNELQVRELYARGSKTVMSSGELVAKMGKAPKTGKKASLEYKAVQAELDQYTKSSKELFDRKMNHDMVALGIEELNASLARTKKAAEAYNTKHAGESKKAGRRATMQELIDKIDAELLMLKKVQQNAGLDAQAANITLEQAMAYTRFDVDMATQASPDVLAEERIDSLQSNENFGSGAVNSVKKLVYKATATQAQEVRIFKPEPEKQVIPQFVQITGVDPANPKFGKRNIASGKASQQLGLGNMIPPAKFATHKGQLGLAMQMAPGKSLVKKVDVEVDPTTYFGLPAAVDARDNGDPNWEAQLPKGVKHKNGKFYKEEARGRPLPLESPPAAAAVVAEVQKQTTSLQVLDAICGQVDRHPENYLLDVDANDNVTLTGIDNDFAFGKDYKDPSNAISGNAFGLPPLIDGALYDRIIAMDWGAFAAGLATELDADEVAGAKARFDWVKAKARQMKKDGLVVDNWQNFRKDGKTAMQILMEDGDDKGNNYYKRDVKAQRSYQQKGHIVND